MTTEAYKVQGSPEWLSFRKNKIGASDAAAIMGLNPYCTPFQKWKEKTGRHTVYMTPSMIRGQQLEPLARTWYEMTTGIPLKTDVVVHPDEEWMFASLDGITLDRDLVVEFKCPGEKTHQMALDGIVPSHYYPQLQHQMAVTGVKEADYVSFDGVNGVIIRVKRDQEFIDKMMDKEEEFLEWVLADYFPGAPQDEISEVATNYLMEAKEAKEHMDYWKERYESSKNNFIISCGNKDVAIDGAKLTKVVRPGNIDYSKIEYLKTIDLEEYRKPSIEAWMLKFT